MNIIWRPVRGFDGTYEVSRHGEVRRIGSLETRKIQITHKGYAKVFLYEGKKQKALFVHRMVAEAFLKPVAGKPNINHKDGHKLHNWVENLEWCTTPENNAHAKRNRLYKPNFGSKHGMATLTEEKVQQARKDYADGKPFAWIARELKVDPATVRRAVIRETWKHI